MMSCYTHVTYITVCSNTFTPCAYKEVRCVERGGGEWAARSRLYLPIRLFRVVTYESKKC